MRYRWIFFLSVILLHCADPPPRDPEVGTDAETSDAEEGRPDAVVEDVGPAPDAEAVDSGVTVECAVPARMGSPAGFAGPQPVLYYTFDDDHRSTRTILNVVGPDLDAAANARVGLGSDGQVGEAAAFDGAQALLTSDPPTSDAFSVALWVRARDWPTDQRRVILNLGNGPAAWQGWGVTLRPSGKVRAFVEGGGGMVNEHVASTQGCIPPGVWVHIAATMDGEHLRLYESPDLA
ncbi:MAG: LamG domain-containing protein [Myxococcota bacterium]